jgi:hypothetical protein
MGGGLGGHLLNMLPSRGASSAASVVTNAAGSGLDLFSVLTSVGGGGVRGAIVMIIVGLIKAQMNKS